MSLVKEIDDDIKDSLPLTAQSYQKLTKDQVQDIDQYLFRFSKFQDIMGDKLFKSIIQRSFIIEIYTGLRNKYFQNN
ncbi:MAG: hypothetical protein KZQ83_06800 [gamma proteobacterium symbiont of Taylorina sp.]|nr:hypothetical protein [gamma proteobacterium symbiont of Taylorina sp.]